MLALAKSRRTKNETADPNTANIHRLEAFNLDAANSRYIILPRCDPNGTLGVRMSLPAILVKSELRF